MESDRRRPEGTVVALKRLAGQGREGVLELLLGLGHLLNQGIEGSLRRLELGALGAERIARARRICWIAGFVAFVSVGAVASFIAVFPDIWVNLFTDDASVRAASRQYLSTAAPMYAFLGLSTTCYFSSQGAAKVIGPVLAQTARLLFIGTGGWWLSTHDATAQDFFKLAAASMILLGVLSCVSVMLTRWEPKQRPVPAVRPALS